MLLISLLFSISITIIVFAHMVEAADIFKYEATLVFIQEAVQT